jgi:transcription elongation factor GreA
MTHKIILTSEGKKILEEELLELLVKRKDIIDKISRAKEQGDLSENAEYHAAREEQGFNEGRIQEIEHTLKIAEIVTSKAGSSTVQLGSSVTVTSNNDESTYTIVGSNETSIEENKISIESPVAKALLQKNVGDTAQVELPSGLKHFVIKSIR